MSVPLRRHEFATGTIQAMASVDSGSVVADPNRRLLTDDTINYSTTDFHYSYEIRVRFYLGHSNVKFHGAIIVYEE